MAREIGRATQDVAKEALRASLKCTGGGNFEVSISTDSVEVAKHICSSVSKIVLSIGGLYLTYSFIRPIIDCAVKNALGGERDDQDDPDIRAGSLHVRLHCLTDKRFLEVLEDYESGRIKQRLQKEFVKVGIKANGLKVQILNMKEVKQTKEVINQRLSCMEGEEAEVRTQNRANQALGDNYIAVEVSEREVFVSNDEQENESNSVQSSSSAGDLDNLEDNLRQQTDGDNASSNGYMEGEEAEAPLEDKVNDAPAENYIAAEVLERELIVSSNGDQESERGSMQPSSSAGDHDNPVDNLRRQTDSDSESSNVTNVSDTEANLGSSEQKRNNVVGVAEENIVPKQVAELEVNVTPNEKTEDNLPQLSSVDTAEDGYENIEDFNDFKDITDVERTSTELESNEDLKDVEEYLNIIITESEISTSESVENKNETTCLENDLCKSEKQNIDDGKPNSKKRKENVSNEEQKVKRRKENDNDGKLHFDDEKQNAEKRKQNENENDERENVMTKKQKVEKGDKPNVSSSNKKANSGGADDDLSRTSAYDVQTRSRQQKEREKYLTVVFHAMLSEKFNKGTITKIVIFGELPIFKGWNIEAAKIEQVRPIEKNRLLLRGEMKVPLRLVGIKVPYKYVLSVNGQDEWEELLEFPTYFSGTVNRVLFIPKSCATEDTIYHLYDGFVYPHPGYFGMLSYKPRPEDRRFFFRIFFPKWSGFLVDNFDCEMKLQEALEILESLVEGLSSVWIQSQYAHEAECENLSYQLNLQKLILELVLPKIAANLEVISCSTSSTKSINDAVISSVVLCYVFSRYNVYLSAKQRVTMLKCLKLPPDRRVCESIMETVNQFSSEALSDSAKLLHTFYDKVFDTKLDLALWLHALPLLHFVERKLQPFEDVKCIGPKNISKWKWWGLDGFDVPALRRSMSLCDVSKMLFEFEDVFKMDRLLIRSFLLLSPIETYLDILQRGHISCLELCVTLGKILPEESSSSYSREKFVNYLSELLLEVNKTLCQIRPDQFPDEKFEENEDLLRNLVTVVHVIKQHLKPHQIGILFRITECIITAITLQASAIEHQNSCDIEDDEKPAGLVEIKDVPDELLRFFKDVLRLIGEFVLRKFPTTRCSNLELKTWSELLCFKVPDCFQSMWHDNFSCQFQHRICRVPPFQIVETFCQLEQKLHPDIATVVSDAAFKAVENLVTRGQRDQEQKTFARLFKSEGSHDKRISLLSRMLEKAWPLKDENKKNEEDVLLEHVLTWQAWPGFFKYFGSSGGSKRILTEKGGIIMAKAESYVEDLIRSVHDGSIAIATLDVLEKNSEQFLCLSEICEENHKKDVSNGNLDIRVSFWNRIAERKEFRVQQEQLKVFIGMCSSFKQEDEKIATLRRKVDEDVDQTSIKNLCNRTSAGIVVVFFAVEPRFSEMITKSSAIQKSRIFNDLWRSNSKKLKDMATMDLIFASVWRTTREELNNIKEKFLSGEMNLTTVEGYLKMFKEDYEGLQKEFKLLLSQSNDEETRHNNQDLLDTRIQQVRDYKKLFNTAEAVRAILELKDALDLEGDFTQVEHIKEIIKGRLSNQPINAIDEKILNAGKLLEDLTPEKRERTDCLKAFQECYKMVTWLREKIKDQQGLKVFVNLAMNSAGEDDMEIDKISCMHTSCLGFGSLIFGWKPEHGFKDLMSLCEPLWQAVNANPTLAEKLRTTNRHLQWLKQIHKSHGSVALTTLMQVEAINSCGIYYIGNKDRAKRSKEKRDELCLENLISLVVPEDTEKQRERKVYTLDEIKDVQSKLMLIAGKAESRKDDVDWFVEVFEGVLRISELYLQLCEVGEINYLTWKENFQSSKFEDSREQLLQSITQSCGNMENSLKIWKDEVNKQRTLCYSLNHFTFKQILKLRKYLAKACTGQIAIDKLPLQTFMLLESVNKNVEPSLLEDVLKTTIPENAIFVTENGFGDEQMYLTKEMEVEDVGKEYAQEEMKVSHPLTEGRRNSLETFNSAKEKLEGMGYAQEYVVAALQHCGRRATEEDFITWVVSGENDDETVMMSCENAKRNPVLSDLLKDVFGSDDEAVDDEKIVADEADEREIVKPIIVSKTDEPYIRNEDDTYLTLAALTAILECLHSPAEVFGCVLSLFMGSKNQPLPTDEEVIICDENTAAEEIELLWRRAVVDETGLLFCLANADLLDYDVSQQAVRSLQNLTQGHAKYHLVVICSIENEDKSNMVASLDQYRRQFPPLTSFKGIQKYLKEKLVSTNTKMVGDIQWLPAASVDRERLSVRVVQSSRAGMGKSLIVKHLAENLNNLPNNKKLRKGLVTSLCPIIPVHGISVDSDHVTRTLLNHAVKPNIPVSRMFHLDMSQSVSKGLDNFLFKLVILRAVKDCSGNIWRRKSTDMYIMEITTDKSFGTLTAEESLSVRTYTQDKRKKLATSKYSFVKFLPRTHCISPRETLNNLQQNKEGDTGFDMHKFHSDEYQRTFQYLTQFEMGANMDQFVYEPRAVVFGQPVDALKILIKYCGIRDPSWAELHHFVNFLNVQLGDCEKSVFCDPKLVGDLLQGFRTFAVRFMIQMSRDFATRSLSDNNLDVDDNPTPEEDDDLAPFQIRRHWESSPHPYIFFNQDRNSMTFLGFRLSNNGDLLDAGTDRVLEPGLMDPTLREQLKLQGLDFDANYEKRDRNARINNLCSVMGIEYWHDPDPTYELTTDNVEKILAIHMRFRCGIPVIIMGETGCGKTRLIRFMCELQAGPDGPKNMLLMKVHGGTTYADIEKKVEDAEKLATFNEKINVDTILFFDEANTTDAIDLIKEIMVDRRVNGRAIDPKLTRLHFIAACNPYRKHTKEMIQKLESAGLGYHVSADETEDKLGSIPLRQLVYRVHPLPESMRPLVWDFGQLTDHTEELYTKQIVRRFVKSPTLHHLDAASPPSECIHGNDVQASCIAKVLSASQKFMREQKNECSFVSLRDVERAMKVITWFYTNSDLITGIIEDEDHTDSSEESSEDESEESAIEQPLNQIVRAVVLGIGVCYYARLNERGVYCADICRYFDSSCPLPGGTRTMQRIIVRCQRAFLKDIQLGQNIARNTALSENVFMMAICTELRIPLFVVGKPGSSKSLAKDVISTNMKAAGSHSELFRNLKQIHMQSYQCSPLSTPEGIVSTFRQCAKLQRDKDLKKFVSVVVLDEIGLAEDSPLMPLKTLHPLLEDGTATAEESGVASDHQRVGFIGLSNWALDPAKMNRGIMLSRGSPSERELLDSARGICSGDECVQRRLDHTIWQLCKGYFDLYKKQRESKTLKDAQKDEFFGLRDFYSLVKMVYGFAVQAENGDDITDIELETSIRRNFSGLDDLYPVKIFSRHFRRLKHCLKYPSPECLPVSLIHQSLGRSEDEGESRYLLVLTENYAALRLLQREFLKGKDHDPVVIFGSSFPKDQHYTQICRNINRIKVCMETGRMVILLNLESLYESLYDALNQYYVYLAEQKYVDLGLGNHRVKCRVADKFKLIVVAEKDVVYQRFPIPLINRLEKHLLVMSTGLTERQIYLVKELEEWVKLFSEAKQESSSGQSVFEPGDCFVGYHSDTAAAVVIKMSYLDDKPNERILSESKYTLLQIASPDAIARLPATKLSHYAKEYWTEYFKNQRHGSLKEYLVHCLECKETENEGSLVQITTHSRLLSQANSRAIASAAKFAGSQCRCISLQEFHTEQQFTKTIEEFFVQLGGAEGLLLVQSDSGEANFNLIACCRYLVDERRRRILEDIEKSVKPIHIVFIIQLPKIAGGCQHFVGFQGGKWRSVHIDELLESHEQLPQIEQLINRSVSDLFQKTNIGRSDDVENMDVDKDLDNLPTDNSELHAENTQNLSENEIEHEEIKPTVLLKSCLQAAAARIYDESPELDRATKRIEILLECLPEDNAQETELSTILTARIYQLLQQRDGRCFENQRLWLQHEALCQGHLQETGTFRKALWQKLSSIVSPMLSEVIAFCDCNNNLGLLHEGKEWKSKLWFTMLNEAQVTPLSYDSFISPVSGKLRERACVQNTGKGHHFKAKFPFSWIIRNMVSEILLQTRDDPSKTLVSLRGAFYTSPLGQLLRPMFEDKVVKDEAAMNYLNDFLHMIYKPRVEGELQLICDAVLSAAGRLHQLLYEDDDLDIPFIHFAYSFIEPRLANFSELVLAFPEVVKKILEMRQKLDVGEMILDVVGLECCIRQLEPSPKELEQRDNRLIWCNRVQSIRPIIEVMKSLILRPQQQQQGHTNNDASFEARLFGEKSAHILQNCRTTWTRIDVVRLFIEHTCPPGQSNHPGGALNAFILWKALGEKPDFSTVHTMTVIEKFLKECSERVSKRLVKFDISQCQVCQNPLQDPVQMPCDHICCLSCANGWFKDHNACPVCRNEVGDDFKVDISERCRKAIEIYNGFRSRCKSFFMELVSQYCFGEQLPDPDLVIKFIGYVIKDENTTEEFTPFDGQGIDVTPVIRSFILQQLLVIKGREKEVLGHLEEYLRRAKGLAEKREHLIEVCVLCVQCMEDVETVKLLKGKVAGKNTQILMASTILERSLRNINISPTTFNIEGLKSIAGIRAALDVLATYLGEDFDKNIENFENLSKCLEAARYLCRNEGRSAIQLFLLKQLVRHDQNGIDAVKERCKRQELKWIMPPQSEEQDKTPDTFIDHHGDYHTVREALGKTILTSNTVDLDAVIQNLQVQPFARSCYVLLALFREITTRFSFNKTEDRIPTRVLEKLTQYIARTQHLPNELKQLAGDLLTNFENANSPLLQLYPQQSGNDRRLIEVLIHFRIVMECLPQNRILQPLRNLALNPAMMTNAFIPTMPQDYGLEAMQVNLGRWYECPNGHRYVITECGRPNQAYKCIECGANIGGLNYNLAANNRDTTRQDRSSTGHILGRAQVEQQTVTPERNLTPLACGVLRCLTHAAMLLGTDQNVPAAAAVIKPPVHDVVQFLMEHLQHDVRCIAQITGNNDDEAIQIIHLVLVDIVNNLNPQQGNIDARLPTTDSRTAWEDAFMTTHLNPILSSITNLLQESFGRMVRDERLGNNRLMRLLHEVDSPNYEIITDLDLMCPALWRYRKKITIEYLSFKFQEYSQGRDTSGRCHVLGEFLKQEHLLRALQYLPDILKLQRLLSEKFYRRLDRNEAEKYTLGNFLKRALEMKEQVNTLVQSFRMAWKILRSSLLQNGRYSISQEMCDLEVKSLTPISMFLPAVSGLGVCASAMTSKLVTLHNNFIGRCKSLLNDKSSSSEIPLTNITKAHLVAYDPEKDLLPMIFAHCDYSLKVGEGTVVEFNWKCLERQLVDRFIRGRPRLMSLVELFVFSKDICDGEVFKALKQKIPQVELSRPVQDQILNELNQLTDVCDVLKSLHIAIGFLSSAGGDPFMSIHNYLHTGLKMAPKDCLKSTKAEQFCQLQHIVSLWLLLSLERARVLTKRKQDPFDDVSENVKSPLDKKQKFNLSGGLQKLNVDYFVRELLEAILLYLKNVPQDQLHFPLSEYINARLEDKACDVIDGLEEHVPGDITVEHAVEAWKVACQKSDDYHSKMLQ